MKTNSFLITGRIVFAFIMIGIVDDANAIEKNPYAVKKGFYENDSRLKAEKGLSKRKKLRKITSGKRKAVTIFMDETGKNLKVKTRKNDKKQVDFFVFDLEGTLVHNYRMKANDEKRITGLQKGTYIYRVFCGDEETAAGKIEIN
ncbi:MAG TPA: T9SS type A sorting domain-containing protein [Chitinophagaceae bacterium]|nr:T9SS type A sorting domain-containing protein [Chitinophagaceae bacterium]